jgi:UDP-glucose 4-epimerase
MVRCDDLEKYFRILPDTRDLNYKKYFSEGEQRISYEQDYSSSSTQRLGLEEIKETLMGLDYIKNELNDGIRQI